MADPWSVLQSQILVFLCWAAPLLLLCADLQMKQKTGGPDLRVEPLPPKHIKLMCQETRRTLKGMSGTEQPASSMLHLTGKMFAGLFSVGCFSFVLEKLS